MRILLYLTLAPVLCLGQLKVITGVARSSQQSSEYSPSDPDLWIDWDGVHTASVDDLGNIIDNITTSDANAYVSTAESSGVLYKKPSRNGEGLYFNELSAFRLGTTSSFNSLHNGTAYTAYISFKYFSQAQATTLRRIISTNGTSATNSLVGFFVANLNSSADPHTIRVAMTAGAGGGTGPFDVTCADNTLVDGEYNELKIVFTGSSLTVYIRNSANPTFTQAGQDNTGAGLSASNAAATMAVGVSGAGFTGYLKHVLLWYRSLTGPETTQVENWLASETAQQITPTPVAVILTGGQSNNNPGSGTDNSTLGATFPELAVPLENVFNYAALTSVFSDHINYWDQMRMAKCGSDATKHNYTLRLGYELAQAGTPVYFIQAGRGSTGLLDKVGSIDWYADGGSATTGDMYPNWKTIVTDGLNELVHVMRKTPTIYAWIWYQGENDTADPNAVSPAYYLAQENLVKSGITFLNSLGYSTTNMDFVQVQPINSGTWAPDVLGDKLDMASEFKTNNPSYSIRNLYTVDVTGFSFNANHVTNTGASQVGTAVFNYIEP